MSESEKQYNSYIQWLDTATDEEKKLKELMLDFEEKYFEDMTYEKIDDRLTKCEANGNDVFEATPDIYITLGQWKIKLIGVAKKYTRKGIILESFLRGWGVIDEGTINWTVL